MGSSVSECSRLLSGFTRIGVLTQPWIVYPKTNMTPWISTSAPRRLTGTISFIKIGTTARIMKLPAPEKKRKARNMPYSKASMVSSSSDADPSDWFDLRC